MTSEEERMAMLAGRPLDALDDDELLQVESWTRLLAEDSTWVEPAPDEQQPAMKRAANEHFIVTHAVEVAGVEQVDSVIQCGMDSCNTFIFVGMAIYARHTHASQRNREELHSNLR